jgi:citrate synthase
VHLQEKLPKEYEEPLPEGLLWLLMTGKVRPRCCCGFNCQGYTSAAGDFLSCATVLLHAQVPSDQQVSSVREDLQARSKLPDYVFKVLHALPADTHPMTQFSMLVMALQVRME